MIRFENVSMSYPNSMTLAVNNLSFAIEGGEFVFIIGESGSGKSTIVKLLTCEEKVKRGSIYVGDYRLNDLKRRFVPYLRRNIGMVFQDFRLIPTKTVFENVAFPMEILGYSRKAIRLQVSMVLSTVGLRSREDAYPNELSGGEQQRVSIARAMVNNPAILLADEPTGNLDPANSETIMALLKQINNSGTTVVIVTHNRELVDRMKKRVIEINDGALVRDDEHSHYMESMPKRKKAHRLYEDADLEPLSEEMSFSIASDFAEFEETEEEENLEFFGTENDIEDADLEDFEYGDSDYPALEFSDEEPNAAAEVEPEIATADKVDEVAAEAGKEEGGAAEPCADVFPSGDDNTNEDAGKQTEEFFVGRKSAEEYFN